MARATTREPLTDMNDTQPYRRARPTQAQRVRRPVRRDQRRANWRLRLGIVGVVLVAVIVVVGGVLLQRAVAFNEAVSTQGAWSMRVFGPFAGGDRANILLLGYSDESREGAFLTDSMNVVSIDRESDVTTMIPIPRDLWVEGLPELPQNLKINEAFRIGYYDGGIERGAELAVKAVSHVTGLDIDGWMALDFQGFQAMVDAIGGITVDNPTAFSYTWDEASWQAGQFVGSFDAGTIELDGVRALDYARNRYTSVPAESSDFARLVRQQRVLQAIKAEVSGWDTLSKGLAIADSLEGHLDTDLGVLDLAMLADKLEVDRRVELREGEILQASTNTIGQYILVVVGQHSTNDYRPLREYVLAALAADG